MQNAKLSERNSRFCTLHFARCTSVGFTLVELLVTISIAAMIAGLSISTFVSFSRTNFVEGNTEAIVSQLRQAQSQTVNALNGDQYGVHITSTSSTLFVGSAYQSGNASNTVFSFYSGVIAIATPSDFVFQKLWGTTTSGTISVYASSNQSITRTISVGQSIISVK